jgi:hypothetical protein
MAKIIANRLKPFLANLILSNQGGFVEKRKIWDTIILVQEVVHSSFTRGEKGMIIKIDMANAFDRVKHNFLNAALEKIGFNQTFISWIGSCINNPWIAPLVNGRPTPFFKASKGLRQVFPLSPLLCVLMEKTLNRILEWGHSSSGSTGIIIVRDVKRINHSQFVDGQGLKTYSPSIQTCVGLVPPNLMRAN